MVLRSVSYFRERDQGHDHVTHGDRGRGQVGQAHVGVNGIVKDEGRGEIIQSGCSWRCLIKCTLIFYCTNPSVHLYSCIILSTETSHGMISNDFHWLRWEMVFTWLGDPWYLRVSWSLNFTVSWAWPLGDQSVRTMVKTSTFSKYFVGSGANPMHTHAVWKSLVWTFWR